MIKRKIKKSQPWRNVFKIYKNNRLCVLSAQLVHFEVLYQVLERTVRKNWNIDWSNFGQLESFWKEVEKRCGDSGTSQFSQFLSVLVHWLDPCTPRGWLTTTVCFTVEMCSYETRCIITALKWKIVIYPLFSGDFVLFSPVFLVSYSHYIGTSQLTHGDDPSFRVKPLKIPLNIYCRSKTKNVAVIEMVTHFIYFSVISRDRLRNNAEGQEEGEEK